VGLFLFTFLLVPISISGRRPARFVSEARPSRRARFAIGALADARASDIRTSAQSKQKPSATEDLFRTNCARCHGADGRGDTPLGHTYNSPDFTDNAWWQKHSDITSTKSLVSIVMNGKGGMPAFGKKLKSVEIKGLVNYVRRFRKRK
jgi:mono/diheme cytochrome c family protein